MAIEKSVFAGITRDSLSFLEVIDIFNGGTIVKTVKDRFFKSMLDLTVSVKDINISVRFKPRKRLVNNNYLPIKVNNSKFNLFSRFRTEILILSVFLPKLLTPLNAISGLDSLVHCFNLLHKGKKKDSILVIKILSNLLTLKNGSIEDCKVKESFTGSSSR
jgi:hypothetical protein